VIVYKSIFAKRTHLRIKPDPTKSDQIKPNQTIFLPAVMLAAPKWHSRFFIAISNDGNDGNDGGVFI